jgi:RNA polymerase sigma-70 factor (ECF subfamily)
MCCVNDPCSAAIGDTIEEPIKLLVVDRALRREARQAVELEQRITALFDELRDPVIRYLTCFRVQAADADEIVQDTFLRLFRYLQGGGTVENMRGWVFRVAHNVALNYIRDAKPAEPLPEDWDEHSSQAGVLSPEEVLLQHEQLRRLFATINRLPLQQRQCLHLRVEGFRYREIAEIMGISIWTVAGYQRRAMKKLIEEVYGER